MKLNLSLKPRRLAWTLRQDLLLLYRPFLLVVGVGAVLLVLIYLLNAANAGTHDLPEAEFHTSWFGISLILGGFIFSAQAFAGLRRGDQGISYLSLPASHLEKLISQWLYTGPVYTLVIWIVYWLISLLGDGLVMSLTGFSHLPFEPMGTSTWTIIRVYLVLHTIFLIGALSFRRYPFFKTSLGLLILGGVLLGFIILMSQVLFIGYQAEDNFMELAPLTESFQVKMESFAKTWSGLAFYWVFPLFLWVVSYLRLSEQEV